MERRERAPSSSPYFVLHLYHVSKAHRRGVQTTTACNAGEIGERDGRCVRIVETADITKTFLQKAIWCGGRKDRQCSGALSLFLGSQAGSGLRKRHVADESEGEFPAMRWVLGKSVAYRKKPSIDMTVPLRNRGHRGQAGMVMLVGCLLVARDFHTSAYVINTQ